MILGDWFTQKGLAAELRVSIDTLRRWAAQRSGPPTTKVGARIFYRREAVIEWLRERERKSERK